MTDSNHKREALSARELIAKILHDHERIETSEGHFYGCECGWIPDIKDAKVYDWQHRLHVTAFILADASIEHRARLAGETEALQAASGLASKMKIAAGNVLEKGDDADASVQYDTAIEIQEAIEDLISPEGRSLAEAREAEIRAATLKMAAETIGHFQLSKPLTEGWLCDPMVLRVEMERAILALSDRDTLAEHDAGLLTPPQQILTQYDDAVEKAHSVGAMSNLKNCEAAIGRWLIGRRAALRAQPPSVEKGKE
jgi:hypothetical protein